MKFSQRVALSNVKNNLQIWLPTKVNQVVNEVDHKEQLHTVELTFDKGLVRKETSLQNMCRSAQPISFGKVVIYPLWVSKDKRWFIGGHTQMGETDFGAYRWDGHQWLREREVSLYTMVHMG